MKQILHWLNENLEEALMVCGLAAMALIMGIQVFSRYLLGASPSWTEEITRYIFIWCGFLSVSFCTKKCLSIKIEQFAASLDRKHKAMLKVFNHTIELAFFLYMIPFAFSYMLSAYTNGQVSPACRIPMYWVQAAPFVSFCLCAWRVAQRWIIEWKVLRGIPVNDPAHPENNTPESFVQAGSPAASGKTDALHERSTS